MFTFTVTETKLINKVENPSKYLITSDSFNLNDYTIEVIVEDNNARIYINGVSMSCIGRWCIPRIITGYKTEIEGDKVIKNWKTQLTKAIKKYEEMVNKNSDIVKCFVCKHKINIQEGEYIYLIGTINGYLCSKCKDNKKEIVLNDYGIILKIKNGKVSYIKI